MRITILDIIILKNKYELKYTFIIIYYIIEKEP